MPLLVHWCPVPPARIACGIEFGLSDTELAYVTCQDCLDVAAEAIAAEAARRP